MTLTVTKGNFKIDLTFVKKNSSYPRFSYQTFIAKIYLLHGLSLLLCMLTACFHVIPDLRHVFCKRSYTLICMGYIDGYS